MVGGLVRLPVSEEVMRGQRLVHLGGCGCLLWGTPTAGTGTRVLKETGSGCTPEPAHVQLAGCGLQTQYSTRMGEEQP